MITLKTQQQIDQIKHNGLILRAAVDKAIAATKVGVTTEFLDNIIAQHIKSEGAIPTFKGYGNTPIRKGFPAASCQSLRDVLIHGVPSHEEIIYDGDIISIDVGVTKNGCIADSCISYGIGNVTDIHRQLLDAAQKITMFGISLCKPEVRIYELSSQIASYAESLGFITMPDFYGHGVGTHLHEEPKIPFSHLNLFKERIPNPRLQEGMVITIEPVVAFPSCKYQYLENKNGWSIHTIDKSWSAQFEHTIRITKTGSEILTGNFPSKLVYE
jgi:methionyl aminopeptidase